MVLGIDPGKQGAFAALSPRGDLVSVAEIPFAGEVPSWPMLKELLEQLKDQGVTKIGIEKVFITGAGDNSVNYARSSAYIECAVLEIFGWAPARIPPVTWQKVIFEGLDTRLKSKELAQQAFTRLWPKAQVARGPKNGKVRDGIADAALIAEYMRRSG